MPNFGETVSTWKANFLESSLIKMREGERVFNYSVARRLFYGKGKDGGFKAFFEENNPLEKAELGIYEIADTCREYLEEVGIELSESLPGLLDKSKYGGEKTDKLLKKTYYLLRSLASSKNQYGIDVYSALNGKQRDLYDLAELNYELAEKQKNNNKPKKKLNTYVTIPDNYLDDPDISNLWDKVENTRENFFITGKAGTGKSTFLHYFARNTKKNVIIAAYTGIAAINIGGTTLHSFFRLPFRPLLPRDDNIPVFSNSSYKRKIIKKMDTLVIDEVSMVRADIMEALDHSLRINGGDKNKPFGGKQLILIGDLFQLPPVVKVDNNAEWDIFEEVYDSPYFFSSHTFKVTHFNFIELKKIYRQNDNDFKDLLNKIREGNVDDTDLKKLNQRHFPDYEPHRDEFVLTLVTTNRLADSINNRKLSEIKKPEFTYSAFIEGDFPKEKYPTAKHLKLKEGAQIIFIKNDINQEAGKERRWVNGTIAKIHELTENEIKVIMEDGKIHNVTKESWENRIYRFDRMKKRVTSEVIGTFWQFPVKLAWAITIHKSQGLTFESLHLNTGRGAFAHGQTYVALSRCRDFNGLTLKKPVNKTDIILDPRVMEFFKKHFVQNQQYNKTQQIINFLTRYTEFSMPMLALHYPFTKKQLQKYYQIMHLGSPYYTYYDKKEKRVQYADFGLTFNHKIAWRSYNSKLKEKAEKESNLQFPLDINTEIQARINAISEEVLQTEEYEKAGKYVKLLREAMTFRESEIPAMNMQDIEKIAQGKKHIIYQLSESFWKNNFKQFITKEVLNNVLDYLLEQKHTINKH